jgi:hypothetical protein
MRFRFRSVSALLAASALGGCLTSQDGGKPSGAAAPYFRYAVLDDSASGAGGKLTLRSALQSGYCDGDSVVKTGSIPIDQPYRFEGDTLVFWISKAWDSTEAEMHDRYLRVSTGTGIRGTWRRIGTRIADPDARIRMRITHPDSGRASPPRTTRPSSRNGWRLPGIP